MSLRSLHWLFAALLLVFAADASLNTAAAKATHSKKSHHHAKSSESESTSAEVGHACSGTPALTIRGDMVTSRGLVDEMANAWQKAGHGCVEVQPFNTLSGIDAALNGSADIAATARGNFAGRAQEAGLTFTPVAWDALVMITSPDNPVSNITLMQLHDIYYGKITNWQQIGGKDEPIDLYTVASPLDGAEYSLRRLLYGSGNAPVMMPRMYVNVSMLEQGVAIDPKSMGLSTLSGVHDNKGVKIIPIEGVTPTSATVADGSYPLYTAIYLASNPSSPHAAQVAQFMDFLGSDEAKKLMRDHDLLPYADAPALTAQTPDQQIASITAKMVSEGLPPPHVIVGAPAPQVAANAHTSEQPPAAAASQATAGVTQTAATVAPQTDAQPQAAAAVTAATTGTKNPALKHAEAVAPSNPVVLTANGAVRPVQPAVSDAHSASYTVVKGDTLSKIARKQSVSVEDLRKWNDLKGDTLRIGQVLQLSATH